MLQWPVKPKAVLAEVAGFSSCLNERHGMGWLPRTSRWGDRREACPKRWRLRALALERTSHG